MKSDALAEPTSNAKPIEGTVIIDPEVFAKPGIPCDLFAIPSLLHVETFMPAQKQLRKDQGHDTVAAILKEQKAVLDPTALF